MTVTLIAAVAANGVIGAGNDMPWHLPGEQQRFKELTWGHPIVMGRKTFESIGRALPGRTSIVVTRSPSWAPPGGPAREILVAAGVDEALEIAYGIDDDVYVIGGGEVYAATIDRADRLEITEVHLEPEGDAFFPKVEPATWFETAREPHEGFTYVTYERVAP
jgi:dihydrofolate reductase